MRLPERPRDHDDRLSLLIREPPAELRLHAQRRKKTRRHSARRHTLGAALLAHARRVRIVRTNRRERLLQLAVLLYLMLTPDATLPLRTERRVVLPVFVGG